MSWQLDNLEPQTTLNSLTIAGMHEALADVGGLKDDGPSRKRARLKDGGHSSKTHLGPHGGTLIIAPTAVLNQWDQELAAKASPAAGRFCTTLLESGS